MTTSLWTRTVALGIVGVASVVGNVSMSASGFATQPVSGTSVKAGAVKREAAKASPRAPVQSRPAATLAADASDQGEVVPAIFARDPDVRFMFYRHLSKWM